MNEKRLVATLMELVRIDSESRNEQRFQHYLREKLDALGLKTFEDDSKTITGWKAGNLIGVLEANADMPGVLFCCHSDTVQPGVGIEPICESGVIRSAGKTILGADDKAGIAILLEVMQTLRETQTPHGRIELVFTVGEEIGLIGAKALDATQLHATHGYVLDSGGKVGGIVVASPTLYTMEAVFRGRAAHAGMEPEKGASAIEMGARAIAQMQLGRLDPLTTANVGTFQGGTATNIVADEAKLTAEVRSVDMERCQAQLQAMEQAMQVAAGSMGGTVDIEVRQQTTGYALPKQGKAVRLAEEAIRAAGRDPVHLVIGGASDANELMLRGIETANLSIGYENVHTEDEYIPVVELEKAAQVAYYIATHAGCEGS